LAKRDRGTTLVFLADMFAALGVNTPAKLYLNLDNEGFLILTGITVSLALVVALLLRASSPNGATGAGQVLA
jgi:hypothetical protein